MPTPPPQPDFALAKIQPPRPRVGLIERPRLERELGRALLEQRLVLLVAPAGYGKTAALTRQIRQLPEGTALAWVCADEDDHLQRFLACLCTALEPYDLPWRMAPDALPTLALGERGLRDVATELVNALAAAELPRGLIVLDDLHRIGDPRIFELLQWLIERLPEHWAVVISSRAEPPLSLARLRVAGELAEFRQDALRFGADEVAALRATLPADAPLPDVQELLQRTAGWPVGLRLSLTVPAGVHPRRLAGVTQRHLFDYLAAEVLDEMPAELQQFLLRCSVLPEMTAARCAHVSGMPQAARLLDELERRSLFVSVLQAEELTLRMHDLVRDFLQDRLQRDHAAELPALLCRAAEHESDLQRAVSWLARAGAWDQAARTLLQRGEPMFMRGGGATVEQLLALFPAAEREARPELQWLQGLAAMQHLDFDALLQAMQQAAAGFERAGDERQAVLARAYACLGLQHAGRLDEEAQDAAGAARAAAGCTDARLRALRQRLVGLCARRRRGHRAAVRAHARRAGAGRRCHAVAPLRHRLGAGGPARHGTAARTLCARRAAHRRRAAERAAVFGAAPARLAGAGRGPARRGAALAGARRRGLPLAGHDARHEPQQRHHPRDARCAVRRARRLPCRRRAAGAGPAAAQPGQPPPRQRIPGAGRAQPGQLGAAGRRRACARSTPRWRAPPTRPNGAWRRCAGS